MELVDYGIRSNGKAHGIVTTKPLVVAKILDLAGYLPNQDLRNTSVIEPAAGDGAFALEILQRLYHSSEKFSFSFQEALQCITFYEMNEKMAAVLRSRVKSMLDTQGVPLPQNLIIEDDFLRTAPPQADVVVGNPPYVRHENIPQAKKDLYRKQFSTFTHRSDLYIPFYEKGLGILKEGGILSYICSNRWLRNSYGKQLRTLIGLHYSLQHVLDLEQTTPFQEEVIAYPAITTIKREAPSPSAPHYVFKDLSKLASFPQNRPPAVQLATQSAEWQPLDMKNGMAGNYYTIEQQGFKIGIGVATGADKVFIGKDLADKLEPETVLPILLAKDLRGNQFAWSGHYVLNPFTEMGKLRELNKYPKANAYLASHEGVLRNRYIAKKRPEHWFRTIDKIDYSLTKKAKIVLPDISGNRRIFIDQGNYYPHHNLYYITGQDLDKLTVLSAFLMSSFARNQLMNRGVTMNGGYPRWQSQNLRKLLFPKLESIPTFIWKGLLRAYAENDLASIDDLVLQSVAHAKTIEPTQISIF